MKSAGRFLLGASVLVGIAVSITSAALADRSVRDVVYSHAADLSLSGGVEPSGATVGHLAAVDVFVEDRGPAAAQNVVLTAQLPTLSTLVGVNQSTGTCTAFDGTLTCPLGSVPRYADVEVQIVLRMPSTPGPQVTTAHVRSTTRDLVKTNNTHNYTVNALARSKDSISAFIPVPGATLSTGHRTSSSNPTSTTVKAHTEYSDALSIAERSTTNTATACGSGFTCFGQYVTAGYVYTTQRKPDIMTVTFDSSEVPHHKSINHVRVFDFGRIVLRCGAASNGAAQPNPCVASRTVLSNGSWQFVIRFTDRLEIRLGGS
jgi:hypothetical protein